MATQSSMAMNQTAFRTLASCKASATTGMAISNPSTQNDAHTPTGTRAKPINFPSFVFADRPVRGKSTETLVR